MANYTSRVVINRAALDEVVVAMADGLFALGERVLEVVAVPDAPPYGEGLIQGGGAIAYVGSKKVAGTTIGGRQIKKPRSLRTTGGQAAASVGFGFPGRFVELGTVDTRANPFLSRAVYAVLPHAEVVIAPAIAKRLALVRSFR